MNNSVYRFTLDVQKSWSQTSIPVRQGDTKREFHITLSDGGKPFVINDGCLANFVGKKSDGTSLYNTCEVEENNTVIYKFTEQTSNVPGVVDCEIEVIDTDSKVIASAKFILVVDERVYNISEVISTDETTTITQYLLNEAARIDAENTRKTFYSGFSEKLNENTEALGILNGEASVQNSVKWLIAAAVAGLKDGADENSDTLKKLDNKITNAKSQAKSYANTAETNATVYADDKASAAETNAKVYADDKASAAETNAKSYADTKKYEAEQYTDGKVIELEGEIAGKLDAKFEAVDENIIRFLVVYPDGSIKAEKIATGGSY